MSVKSLHGVTIRLSKDITGPRVSFSFRLSSVSFNVSTTVLLFVSHVVSPLTYSNYKVHPPLLHISFGRTLEVETVKCLLKMFQSLTKV
jgi:hypothetical protein